MRKLYILPIAIIIVLSTFFVSSKIDQAKDNKSVDDPNIEQKYIQSVTTNNLPAKVAFDVPFT